MKEKIAVATVSGKAYYLIVNELKRKNIPFLSLKPNDHIPAEIKVVITTEKEKPLIKCEKILVYQDAISSEALVNEALQIISGKEHYERIIIGIDPGEVFGLAVLADGKVIETSNCFSIKETSEKIVGILKNLKNQKTFILVKIGDGVLACKEKLLHDLDNVLPSNVILESVHEAGTNRYLNETKHRRGLRDIVSAIKIAGREGQIFQRRKPNGPNS